jgi:hypothetical protein
MNQRDILIGYRPIETHSFGAGTLKFHAGFLKLTDSSLKDLLGRNELRVPFVNLMRGMREFVRQFAKWVRPIL